MAAVGRRQLLVFLLLFFFVVSSTAVPLSRINRVLFGSNFHSQDVKEIENDDGVLAKMLERRMNIELTDYPGTGANHNHDPKPPGN